MAIPPGWDAETLWQQLVPLWPGISVEVVPVAASTNTTLLQRTAVDPAPCLLVAEHQTQGRGRMGRTWHSAPGASLTFSLAVPLAPQRWEGLSLAVGLALAQALEPLPDNGAPAPPRLLLKWPNDLWLREAEAPGTHPNVNTSPGHKLGGVLVETASRGGQRWVVVGVGLNILPQPADAAMGAEASTRAPAPHLSHGYACLQALHPAWTAQQALACVAAPLAQALRRFESAGFAPLVAAFATRDLLRGRAVTTSSSPPLQGLALGVDSDGALLVQADGPPNGPNGTNGPHGLNPVHRVHSGEVSVRLQPTPGAPAPTAQPAAESA